MPPIFKQNNNLHGIIDALYFNKIFLQLRLRYEHDIGLWTLNRTWFDQYRPMPLFNCWRNNLVNCKGKINYYLFWNQWLLWIHCIECCTVLGYLTGQHPQLSGELFQEVLYQESLGDGGWYLWSLLSTRETLDVEHPQPEHGSEGSLFGLYLPRSKAVSFNFSPRSISIDLTTNSRYWNRN